MLMWASHLAARPHQLSPLITRGFSQTAKRSRKHIHPCQIWMPPQSNYLCPSLPPTCFICLSPSCMNSSSPLFSSMKLCTLIFFTVYTPSHKPPLLTHSALSFFLHLYSSAGFTSGVETFKIKHTSNHSAAGKNTWIFLWRTQECMPSIIFSN